MNYTASSLLALGASPVMAYAQNEVAEMVSFAGALVLNIGTLTDDWIGSMVKAGIKASALGTPIILDPVGSGATPLRTNAAKHIAVLHADKIPVSENLKIFLLTDQFV